MMSYTSYGFLLLTAAGLAVTGILRQSGKRWVLLAMSLVFMAAAGGYETVLFWFVSTAAGFAAALLLEENFSAGRIFRVRREEKRRTSGEGRMPGEDETPAGASAFAGRRKRGILLIVVAFQLALLAWFKYANLPGYTAEAFYELTGREYEWELIERVSLTGISFYTLMIIGYEIDVYRGETKAVRSFPKFSLFTGYFGHFLQGPIDTWEGAGDSLASPARVSFSDVQDGCLRILSGLFLKLVISERLAVMVDTVYGDYSSYGGGYLMLAAVAFSLQLYTDFCGCMDLVCGVSRLFGIRLAENFRQPFFSESVSEFWRRWHITLGAFLRKYVYIPLGGNRKGVLRKYGNTLAVFLLSGLWHGGKWTFIIGTGLLQGVYMIIGALLEPLAIAFFRFVRVKRTAPILRLLRRIRTFVLITVGFVLFRSDTLTMAGEILLGMLRQSRYPEYAEGVWHSGLGAADFAVLLIALTVLFLISLWREKRGEEKLLRGEAIRTIACFGMLFLILVFGCYGKGYDSSSFIYSRF